LLDIQPFAKTKIKSSSYSPSATVIGSRTFFNIGAQLGIYVDMENTAYCDVDGTLFTKDKQKLLHFHKTEGVKEYTLPNEV